MFVEKLTKDDINNFLFNNFKSKFDNLVDV